MLYPRPATGPCGGIASTPLPEILHLVVKFLYRGGFLGGLVPFVSNCTLGGLRALGSLGAIPFSLSRVVNIGGWSITGPIFGVNFRTWSKVMNESFSQLLSFTHCSKHPELVLFRMEFD